MAVQRFLITWREPSAELIAAARSRGAILTASIENESTAISLPAPVEKKMHFAALERVLTTTAIPVVHASTAREAVIELLKLAAEVEHALMAQYLYAAFSVVKGGAGASGNYRRKLLNVAVQEMGHLITVQNLLLLLGGRDEIHFQRDVLRKSSPNNPLPFVLSPVTRVSLASYVAAEMPADVPVGIRQKVDELVALAEQELGTGLRRVGVIYTLLIWFFTPEEKAASWIEIGPYAPWMQKLGRLKDSDLQASDIMERFEAQRDEWHAGDGGAGFILETPRTLEQGRNALEEVAEQGEGLSSGGDSHFQEFLEMVDAFDNGSIRVHAMAKSPYVVAGNSGEQGIEIQNPYARLWAGVFDRQYGLLVLCLYHSVVTDRAESARSELIEHAFVIMQTAIEPLSDLIAGLSLDSASGLKAGPPYSLDPEIIPPVPDISLWRRHEVILDELEQHYERIKQDASYPATVRHQIVLANLRDQDNAHREVVNSHLAPGLA